MAKQITWSFRALNDRKGILDYWIKRNQSKEYSKKLDSLFKDAVRLIAHYPEIGKQTDRRGVRIKVVRNYLLIYELNNEQLIILTIWDSRQNPQKLLKELKK